MASVEITTPDGAQEFALQSERVTIGRLSANDIVLPFSHISRRHAELRWFNGAWWITDLHSTNGLHVGGQRIQETPLEVGSIVALSPHVTLRLLATPPPTQTPPPAHTSPPQPEQPLSEPMTPAPLSAYGPRSPFADDESPYYPHMRPAPPPSQPRGSQPGTRTPQLSGAHPGAPPRAPHPADARSSRAAADSADAQRAATERLRMRRPPRGAPTTALHICQTCGQLTAPDALYCQNCHHSIAIECPHCQLSLLPIQETCPRCQAPNPGAARRGRPASR